MKKIFIIGIVLFFISILFSQTMNEMIVIRQAVRRTDQLINTARKDRMGRVCAGLLIYTDLSGLSFDSNNGLVDLTHEPGSYMVFVSEGERVLYIYKEGFKPLEIILSEYGIIGLKSGQVYQLDVTAKDKENTSTQRIVFNVKPEDARIKVGSLNFYSGQAQSLPLGENEVYIEKEGYKTVKDIITVSNDNILFNYNLTPIEPVLVKIRTSPEQAQIFINNSEKGLSNRDLWLYPGLYEVKLIKSQYLSVEEVLLVSETGDNTNSYNLERNTGKINFIINPVNASVYVNNEKIDTTENIDLSPGIYRIEIKADKYHTITETIEIKHDTVLNKNYNLIPRKGNLLLTIIPTDSKTDIYADGKLISSTTGSARISDLFIGEYTVICSADGFISQESKINIKENENTNLNIELKKGHSDSKGLIQSKTVSQKEPEQDVKKINQTSIQTIKKMKPKNAYLGLSIGASVPVGDFADENNGAAETGLQLSLISFSYIFNNYFGFTTTISGSSNAINIEDLDLDPWVYTSFLIGPIFHLPLTEKANVFLKMQLGNSVVTAPDFGLGEAESSSFSYSFGSQLNYRIANNIALTMNMDYFSTQAEFEYKDINVIIEQNVDTISFCIGMAFLF